jgi:hypothetical protein
VKTFREILLASASLGFTAALIFAEAVLSGFHPRAALVFHLSLGALAVLSFLGLAWIKRRRRNSSQDIVR